VVFGQPFVVGATPGVPGRQALTAAGATVQERLAEHVKLAVERTGQQLPADL
jgi:hypothetical protein